MTRQVDCGVIVYIFRVHLQEWAVRYSHLAENSAVQVKMGKLEMEEAERSTGEFCLHFICLKRIRNGPEFLVFFKFCNYASLYEWKKIYSAYMFNGGFFLRQSCFSTWPKIEVSGRKIFCGFANTMEEHGATVRM